ncbi:MAG: hypothetical protein JXB14_02355 [Candidatus Altiarchaeota archaeon]|nr:hypothetical protein [Candidatus Altiarchaeota archaeon]
MHSATSPKTNKFVVRGLKKSLALTRIKIGLAKDFGTESIGFENRPLELSLLFSGRRVETIGQAVEQLSFLKGNLDLNNDQNIAETVIQLMEIIEGVKQEFEPRKEPYWGYIDQKKAETLEQMKKRQAAVLLFSGPVPDSLNFYVGGRPPSGAIPLGESPSAVVFFAQYAFKSGLFSRGKRLDKTKSVLGHKTVLMDAVHFALGQLGAETVDDSDGPDF